MSNLDEWDRIAVADALVFTAFFCGEMAIKERPGKSKNRLQEGRRLAGVLGLEEEYEELLRRRMAASLTKDPKV